MNGNALYFKEPIYVTRPILPSIDDFSQKIAEVWNSYRLTNNGPQHQKLEESLSRRLKVPYLSLFNNGTIALIVACQSLRLSGEVITTPFTFSATPHILSWNRINPIFCDIEPNTMNIDVSKIESMITPQTTGILAVHVFGTPCDVDSIQEVADRYGLRVIYDAAHAFDVEVDGVGIGTFGDITMFSFHATKLFHTAEGGALTFNNKNLKARIDLLKNFGIKNEEEVMMPGINGKMNELQASLGLEVLKLVDVEQIKRADLFKVYCESLSDVKGITFLQNNVKGIKSGYQYFIIKINEVEFGKSRDYVYQELKKYNVFARKYFYPICSNYPCYKHLPSASYSLLPIANIISSQILALPFYGDLSKDHVYKICEILKIIKDK